MNATKLCFLPSLCHWVAYSTLTGCVRFKQMFSLYFFTTTIILSGLKRSKIKPWKNELQFVQPLFNSFTLHQNYFSRGPFPTSSQTQPIMRTEPYVFTTATPPSTRSQTAACGPSVPPEKSPYPGHYSPSMPGLHLRPNHKELSQSGVGSSGYSSSEGLSDAPSSGYRSRISSAFLGVMGEYQSLSMCVYINASDMTTY